ncbi:aldehyde dehydrogenase family protein [Paraburkholderia phosphatilytica]|uniref:aldehyde dehydrogenase family protein n=1 Tax=Paraburkholderia phosphatilytica TaxID=2282883 RepID=UPI000E47B9D7|nr:aldehyde dehydrogenase family protein [Paraburkholderia phosphatilytica]
MSDTIEVFSPFDGSLIGTVPSASETDVERALATAYALFRNRREWLPKQQRLAILKRAAEIITSRREEIARQAAHEGGKPLKDSLIEVDRGIDGIHTCIEELRTKGGHVVPMDLNATSAGRVAFTQYEPIGVVVGISAFNHPFNLVVHQIAPAVAVGAPVIIKPAPSTPLSCKTLIDIFHEAGLPPQWAQMVLPKDLELATRLVTDSRVGFFSFIGSAGVGWMLKSKLAPGTRSALEHGGAAPVIVSHDANLDMALPRLARGGFWHAGQACVSVQRVLCHRSIANDVANGIANLGDKMITGDPLLMSTDVGPLISREEVNRVARWVGSAVNTGAKLVSGGKKLSDSCYANTVLLDPGTNEDVTLKEIFGPVVCVYSYDDMDSAIALSNSLPFSFQAAVFTQNIETAMHCYRQLDGTAIMVNENTLFRVDWMPFAGARSSGLGVGGIPSTMHDMQTEKMMVWRSDALN